MKKLLDIGCGPGTIGNLGYYRKYEKEYQIYGIDFLPEYIQQIKQRYTKGNFKIANSHKLPFNNAKFDLIIARHVLEHVLDLKKTLSELVRVAKPNAKIIIAVPHPRLEKILNRIFPIHYQNTHHQRVFSKQSLTDLLTNYNIKINTFKTEKWPWFIIVVLLSLSTKLFSFITIQNQSGVFKFGSYGFDSSKHQFIAKVIYDFLTGMNRLFYFLNSYIPFEYEIVAEKLSLLDK